MNSAAPPLAAAPAAGASQQAISYHYDVSNEFYALWLDPRMVYSCARWEPQDDLETAQLRKLDWHLEHAAVMQGTSVLDVGCGWGAGLQRALEKYQAQRAVGLTLSEQQASWARLRGRDGLEVRLESWRDHVASGAYDAIISIGAFEHFATPRQSEDEKLAGYREFFEFCHRALRRGGRLSLQTITYENSHRSQFSPFFAQSVFPESDLPRLMQITRASEYLFEIEVLQNERQHYARTLRVWLARLRAARARAVELVGEEKTAIYERYLALTIVGFHTGTMNLARISMKRTDAPVR